MCTASWCILWQLSKLCSVGFHSCALKCCHKSLMLPGIYRLQIWTMYDLTTVHELQAQTPHTDRLNSLDLSTLWKQYCPQVSKSDSKLMAEHCEPYWPSPCGLKCYNWLQLSWDPADQICAFRDFVYKLQMCIRHKSAINSVANLQGQLYNTNNNNRIGCYHPSGLLNHARWLWLQTHILHRTQSPLFLDLLFSGTPSTTVSDTVCILLDQHKTMSTAMKAMQKSRWPVTWKGRGIWKWSGKIQSWGKIGEYLFLSVA